MNKIIANCTKCEKPLGFRSLTSHESNLISSKTIPISLHMTLNGTTVICGGCGVANVYQYDIENNKAEVVSPC